MSYITICVADNEECNHKCKRRLIIPDKYDQSYANFSLDYFNKEKNTCEAYIGLNHKNKELKIN